MKNFIDTIRRQVTEFFGKRSKKQKALMGIGAAVLLAAIVIASLTLGKVQYEVLYTGLDEAEAGEIMTVLKDKDVDAKAEGTGTILVPSDVADGVRMELAAEGYPQSGLNYDIFSNASSFGKTDLEMKTYEQYQLQENLRDTILMLDKIKDCVVIINMAQDSLFVLSSDQQESSASVMLDIKDGETLSSDEAKAIAELVSKSVPGLTPENVRIVDTNMNLYNATGGDEEEYTGTQYQLTEQVKQSLSDSVLSVLTPVFGKNNVSAAVNVALDFDKKTVNTVEFAPPVDGDDSGLVVSMEELYDRTQSADTAEGTPGTDSNGVGVDQTQNADTAGGTPGTDANGVSEYLSEDANPDDFSKISRTINYELNQTQTQIEKAQGSIAQLSVAVLLNSDAYSGDYADSVTQLVAKAIGVDESLVSVVSLPFQAKDGDSEISGAFDTQASLLDKMNRKDIMTTAIIALTVLAVLIAVIRFLRYYLIDSRKRKTPVTPDGYVINIPEGGIEETAKEAVKDIPDRIKSEDTEQIERFVDKDPAAVAQLLRNWLTGDDR